MKNHQSAGRPGSPLPLRAFTLIELLVVIAIIAVLAAFTIPVLKSVARKKILDRTRTEMAALETAIQSYHAAYGFYPPSNPHYRTSSSQAMFSPLYFELLGTTNNTSTGAYYALDGSANITDLSADLNNAYGVGGFINCTKPGAGEDSPAARNFLPDLKPNQIGTFMTNIYNSANIPTTLLLASVGGPDQSYQPLNTANVNPWRYVSPGVNNPQSYDLWVQLVISGQTNLVCNWSKQVQHSSPLP